MAFYRQFQNLNRRLFTQLSSARNGPVCCNFHWTPICKRAKPEGSSEPVQFTSSKANVPSKPKLKDVNEYQGLIVAASLLVFMSYFFYLREENDLDEKLYEPVPILEEAYLMQRIAWLRESGLDTKEEEAHLEEVRQKILATEQKYTQ